MNKLEIIDTCDGCGACCWEQESPPMYHFILKRLEGLECGGIAFYEEHCPEDLKRVRALPEELKQELRDYSATLKESGHPNDNICIWFDESTRNCKHYDLRPEVCREFEIGGSYCRTWRESYDHEIIQK
jgi:Fe-S-cluster containining protein